MRLERGLDEIRIRARPGEPRQHADVTALDEPEAARAPGDLRKLPRQQVTTLLTVELRRLREQQRLAREVDAVTEHVRRERDVRGAAEKPVDLLTPRRERHRAVEHCDAARMEPVHLPGEREHRFAAERDDDRSRSQRAKRHLADPLERKLSLEDLHLDAREGVTHQWLRVERPQNEDVTVLASEEEPCPRRAALVVVGPLHLVEDEHLAARGRHLHGAADDRRAFVDALLARDEPDALLAQLAGKAPVGLLRQHPQRARVHASYLLLEERERMVGLAGVRGAEMGDDRLRFDTALRKQDLDAVLGAANRRAHGGARPPPRLGPRRAARAAPPVSPAAHQRQPTLGQTVGSDPAF